MEAIQNDLQVCKRRLDSKIEALLILSKELDQCRTERDQFKLMAEQLRERYQSLKWQVSGKSPALSDCDGADPAVVSQLKNEDGLSQNVPLALYRAKEANKCLHFEVDDLKQKLNDAEGDVKLLREQIARQRVGTADEGMNTRHFPAHEREELVKQLEASQVKRAQLERDLQQVIDEKEEQETERDAFKHKYERLNTELNYILKGDEHRILDIDGLVNENRYLSERIKQMEEEKAIAMATVSKYKSILEKKKNRGIIKLGQTRNNGVVISQKQVHHLLEQQAALTVSPQTMADLQGLAKALLDSLNDKNLALSHQRKTNKILGTRVAELEKQLKTLEVGGFWNIPEHQYATLEKLKSECCDIKSLIPDQRSSSGQTNDETVSESGAEADTSPLDHAHAQTSPLRSLMSPVDSESLLSDLDLLPTREKERVTDLLDCFDNDVASDEQSWGEASPGDVEAAESDTEHQNTDIISDTYIKDQDDIENELQSLLECATSNISKKGKVSQSKRREALTEVDDDDDCSKLL